MRFERKGAPAPRVMAKRKIFTTALLVVVVLSGIVFIAVHYLSRASEGCAQANERYSAAERHYEQESTAALEVLNFLNDENSYGYAATDDGKNQIDAVRQILNERSDQEQDGCTSGFGASELTAAADALENQAIKLHNATATLTEGVLVHAAPLIGEEAAESQRKITEAIESARENVSKANNVEGFGQIDGSLEILMNAQRLVDSPTEIPEVPDSLGSLDDLRAANLALKQMDEIRAEAEQYASELVQVVGNYADVLGEDSTEATSAGAEGIESCNDIVVVGRQCTEFSEIQYLASNGWDVNSAWNDAIASGCAHISATDNACAP